MKPILITGAAQGLGAAIAGALAAQGFDLVLHYRKTDPETTLRRCREHGVQAEALQGDFSSIEALEDFIRRYTAKYSESVGLVNNVGNYLIAPSSETGGAEWIDLFQTNLFTPVYLIKALLPQLQASRGSVVNVGTSGLNRAHQKAPAYATSKASLAFYTRSLARELAPSGVRVNMVSPGFLENAVDLAEAPELPMGRPATLEEAAHAVAFFFDARTRYITGQNLEVSGGFGL